MPADAEEVAEAMEEGVQFRFLSAPAEIIGTPGAVIVARADGGGKAGCDRLEIHRTTWPRRESARTARSAAGKIRRRDQNKRYRPVVSSTTRRSLRDPPDMLENKIQKLGNRETCHS